MTTSSLSPLDRVKMALAAIAESQAASNIRLDRIERLIESNARAIAAHGEEVRTSLADRVNIVEGVAVQRSPAQTARPARPAAALLRGSKPTINPFEVTLERLGAAIKMGLYDPGDQLPSERDMAQMMGISRTTVREAIGLLVAQGVLVVKRGRAS